MIIYYHEIFQYVDLKAAVVAYHFDEADQRHRANKAEHSDEDVPTNYLETCKCIKLFMKP